VTYYTIFVIELQARRVHVAGSTPSPDEAFAVQAMRSLSNAMDGILADGCVLICDRDRKWSACRAGVPPPGGSADHSDAVPGTELQPPDRTKADDCITSQS